MSLPEDFTQTFCFESATQEERDIYWMSRAIALAAQAADVGEVPVGALVVKDNNVVASAYNLPISTNNPTAHAEILVIQAAGKALDNYRLSDCTLYVSLEPCTMCFGAMVHSRIARLVYGATEPKAGVIQSQLQLPQANFYNHYFEVVGGVLAERCSQQLSEFFAQRRERIKAEKQAKKLAQQQAELELKASL